MIDASAALAARPTSTSAALAARPVSTSATTDLHLSGIFIHPVKSCAAVALHDARVEHLGLAHDRRWMLVEAGSGQFITGRECPELVLLSATITDGALQLSATSPRNLAPRTVIITLKQRQVRVWDDAVIAALADAETNLALSNWLGRSVELVHFDARSQRILDQKYAQADDQTAFSDGYPALLISQASLDELNARLVAAAPGQPNQPGFNQPITMRRFRPNLVIGGTIPAHAEDSWQRVQIGAALFDVVKPCVRCVFTTVDADLGARDPTGEPLTTLKTYRRTPKGITFGMNLIPRNPGVMIQVGDVLSVIA